MKKYILLMITVLLFAGCDSFTDCFINNRPQLNEKFFPSGSIGVYYEDSLNAEINNDPSDNAYFYYFSVTGLPSGMDYESYGRELVIFGTPRESGRYLLNVHLNVEAEVLYFDETDGPFEDGDTLCEDSTSKVYNLTIQ